MATISDADRFYEQIRDGDEKGRLRRLSLPPFSFFPTNERAVYDEARFCRIHLVVTGGAVVVGDAPPDGSPCQVLYKNPSAAHRPAAAVFMGQMTFELPVPTGGDPQARRFQGTFFDAAPGYALTAGRCMDDRIGDQWLGKLVDIRGVGGSFVPFAALERDALVVSCQGLEFQNDMRRSSLGLPTTGADVAVLKVTGPRERFLLPCSPEADMQVAVFSYPNIFAFMKRAKSQLLWGKPPGDGDIDIWELYRAAVAGHGVSTRQDLYKMLDDAFDGFASGQLVVSPGTIKILGSHSVGVCYTALGGSSGAPICSLDSPDFYCGIHVAGSAADINIGTSCDNPAFVRMFRRHLLDRLPGPYEAVWSSFATLEPFFKWLDKHKLVWERPRAAEEARSVPSSASGTAAPLVTQSTCVGS